MNSLWRSLRQAWRLSERWLADPQARVGLDALERGSSLGGRLGELRGRSVLLSTSDQLSAALALIEFQLVGHALERHGDDDEESQRPERALHKHH